MKESPESPVPASGRSPSKRKKGFAIITVLGVLVIVAVLIVAFLSMASDELQSSKKYSEGLRVRQLRDIAINMVIAQIQEATSFEDTAWASQPGAIRIFQDGELANAYKLYSSNKMVVPTAQELLTDYLKGWDLDKAAWVDINEPVVKEDTVTFPIVDPRAFSVDENLSIEGFSYESGAVNGIVRPSGADPEAAKRQRLPMPVRWVYVLRDGTLGSLSTSGRYEGPKQPTEINPIVGRIAFWTDDETCKINYNTASHGTFWDTPRADTDEERDFGSIQPVQHEWQRYPGHPATTSLAPIFFPNQDLDPKSANDRRFIEDIYALCPRVQTGGTREGTNPSTIPIDKNRDKSRLYASLDEVIFSTKLTGDRREENNLLERNSGSSEITRQILERARFFTTVNSRAPEITLWGTPRMSMWPLHEQDSTSTRSQFDRLIAFCTSAGRDGNRPFKYYYQRSDQNSRHYDYYRRDMYNNIDWYGRNPQIFDYVVSLLDRHVPGYADSLAKKYGRYNNLSTSATNKFSECQQILAEIFDYVRSTNLVDGSVSTTYGQRGGGTGQSNAQVAGICLCGGSPTHTNVWNKLWSRDPKGFGRIYSVSEVALVFLCRAVKTFTEEGTPQEFGNAQDLDNINPNQRWIEIGLLVEGFAPTQGFAMIQPQCSWLLQDDNKHRSFRGATIEGRPIDHFTSTGGALGENGNAPGGYPSLTSSSSSNLQKWFGWGGYGGYRFFNTRSVHTSDDEGERIILPSNKRTMTVNLGSAQAARIVTFDVNSTGGMSTGNLLQDIRVQFPTFTSPVPEIVVGGGTHWWTWNTRLQRANQDPGTAASQRDGAVIHGDNTDVVRSMVCSHGDYRLIHGKRNIPVQMFAPAYGYEDRGRFLAHSLTGSSRSDMAPDRRSAFEEKGRSLVQGVNYNPKIVPDFPLVPEHPLYSPLTPSAYTSVYSIDPSVTGDWDNGISNCPDGAYINKADDGVQPSANAYFIGEGNANTNFVGNGSRLSNFSPNRMIPSAGMLGSLSSGIQAHIPWRTLLFRPMPRNGRGPENASHFGQETPPDHIWLDLFWMPTVEPYAISEPFSTAGKINLNYHIVPFTYMRRATGIHALLESEKLIAIPNTDGQVYKTGASGKRYRHEIDPDETLTFWDAKFKEGGFFRSGSEICEMWMVPENETASGIENFWDRHRLTGDNSRERIYTTLYSRVTTKSNTYKIHMVVQTVQKAKSSPVDSFVPGRDKVTSEYRGSSIVERYIDPNDPTIPDYVQEHDAEPLDRFYRFRIVSNTRFAP